MSERELTPEEEAQISRLLGDAASPAPIPTDVALRLDDVLAGLVAERSEETNVVPLRSRRWPKVLVAAAAVSVLGYAGTNLVQRSADGIATSAESELADSAGSGDDRAAAPELAPSAPTSSPRDPATTGLPSVDKVRRVSDTLNQLAYQVSGKRLFADAELGGVSFATTTCALPAAWRRASDEAYDLRLAEQSRGFVLVRNVNRHSVVVNIYSCKRPLLPVSSAFVLAAR